MNFCDSLIAHLAQTLVHGYGIMQPYSRHHRLHAVEGDYLTGAIDGFDSLWRNDGNHAQHRRIEPNRQAEYPVTGEQSSRRSAG